MMKVFKILSTLLITILFTQCGVTKFQKNPPFSITSIIKKKNLEENNKVKGTSIQISYTSLFSVEFESLYYSNSIVKLHKDNKNKSKIITAFLPMYKKQDLILDANSTKELNNSFPEIKKLPFNLAKDEAVISYKVKEKLKFHKFKIPN